MLKIEDAKEFCEIPGWYKFSHSAAGNLVGETFKDGRKASNWFYAYKNAILKSNEVYCVEIKKQYNEFMDYVLANKNETLNSTPFQDSIIAFMKIPNLSKFVVALPFRIVGYTNTARFFRVNGGYILNSNSPYCLEIRKQYIQHKIKYRKQRDEFCKELNIDKFDPECDLFFQSYPNEKMSDWFFCYKKFISESDTPVEEEIMFQYGIYKKERPMILEKSRYTK